jgi:hypothetical protein
MRHRIRITLAVTTLCLLSCNVVGEVDHIDLGFVNVETVTAADRPGGVQHMTSGIVVRIFDKSERREAFAISNEAGIVVVPLRPGEYCLEAFSHTGARLKLDPEQSACLSIRAGEVTTAGVAVAQRAVAH